MNTATATTHIPVKIAQVAGEWSALAKEPVEIMGDYIGQPIYAFGSEIAALRLFHAFAGRGRVAFSENMRRWYFVLEGI